VTKKHHETKREEVQAESHKNRTVRFWISEYPVFPKQIEFGLPDRTIWFALPDCPVC
jgi:hypothetical protein